jgi:hypothetical protein
VWRRPLQRLPFFLVFLPFFAATPMVVSHWLCLVVACGSFAETVFLVLLYCFLGFNVGDDVMMHA